MATKSNQGFLKSLNLIETPNDTIAINNLAGAGIAGDLRIIQNNLRNTSDVSTINTFIGVATASGNIGVTTTFITGINTTGIAGGQTLKLIVGVINADTRVTSVGIETVFLDKKTFNAESLTGQSFSFGSNANVSVGVTSGNIPVSGGFFTYPNNEFVFTNDDVVGVSVNVNVGSTELSVGTNYFVCNSNGETQFKLSFTPSSGGGSTGVNTITVGTNSGYNFNLIRKDAVIEQNLINYIQPDIQDTENFSYLSGGGSVNSTMTATASNNETAAFLITKKYRVDEDRTIPKDIKFEGTVIIKDPVALNVNTAGLGSEKSPGVFIGTTRAFSSDNNPWSEVGSALQTSSTEVSVGELNFDNSAGTIIIEGITVDSDSSVLATTFTHKLPVVINGETYYLLLRT